MSDPKLSVIIPAYNAEKTIQRSIDSILNQSFDDYELIIVNDGSEDDTEAICSRLGRSDQRIRFIAQNNQGVSAARNIGIKYARGKYLMFVDDDDEILPRYLSAYVEAIESSQSDLVIGGITKVFLDQSVRQEIFLSDTEPGDYSMDRFWDIMCFNSELFGYLVNKVFKADVIKSKGLILRTDMCSQEDLDFCLSYYKYCKKVSIIQEVGYLYYYQAGKRKPQTYHYIENQLKLIRTAEEQTELSPEALQAVRDRVVLWVYTLCYSAESKEELYNHLAVLNQVSGLYSFLKGTKVTDEKTMVVRWYCLRMYKKIYRYFECRKRIKKVSSVFRKC